MVECIEDDGVDAAHGSEGVRRGTKGYAGVRRGTQGYAGGM